MLRRRLGHDPRRHRGTHQQGGLSARQFWQRQEPFHGDRSICCCSTTLLCGLLRNWLPSIDRHNAWIQGKKFLLITYYMLSAKTMESHILGEYVNQVQRLHPGLEASWCFSDPKLDVSGR